MRKFFQGQRRNIGCAILVMALAFTAGWVRSSTLEDVFKFQSGRQTEISLRSGDFGLLLGTSRESGSENRALSQPVGSLRHFTGPKFESIPVTDVHPVIESPESGIAANAETTVDQATDDNITMKWQFVWQLDGFCVGGFEVVDGETNVCMGAPYWGIVLPLALLAAYLLWKPREATAMSLKQAGAAAC